MSNKIKISELLKKLYNGSILNDQEYNKYISLIQAYECKENNKSKTKRYIDEISN